MQDSRVACPVCKRRYVSGQVAILGHHGLDYLIRCACTCGAIATFLVTNEDDPRQPPIAFEDVLIAHKFLEEYAGGIDGLFNKELPPETVT